jgi:acetate kinase
MRRVQQPLQPQAAATADVLERITDALGLAHPPHAIAHRIVHGGDATGPRVLDTVEMARLDALAALAPLHQPPALDLARTAARLWPDAMQYGVFDTTWHAGLPASSRRLPVPASWDALGVRRHGFHGLAFASAMRILVRLQPGSAQGRVVIAHLGGGSSLCAVKAGRSIDTTMSMTPLDGLPMATRSGSLDPGALLFMMRREGLDADGLERMLYRESGLRGISGVSGDVRELLVASTTHPGAALALEIYALRIAQGVAAMAATLGGIDDLVFTGGVGFHAGAIRAAVATRLAWLGIGLDPVREEEALLSLPDSAVRAWRIDVDEEREIAIACQAPETGPGAWA